VEEVMTLDDYFDLVLQVMKKQATYSEARRAWVISRTSAQFTLLDHLDYLPNRFATAPDLLKEGVRRGLWEVGVDEPRRTVVIIK
jgi:hypothetical protein